MRFHKSESAFFVFIAVILAGGRGDAARLWRAVEPRRTGSTLEPRRRASPISRKLLFATGVLLATALFFGIFFIYPLIRTQVRKRASCAP